MHMYYFAITSIRLKIFLACTILIRNLLYTMQSHALPVNMVYEHIKRKVDYVSNRLK